MSNAIMRLERFMPYALERFRGIFPAALTMFDRDNNFDQEATARRWGWLVTHQKADGLVITGMSLPAR